MEAGFKQLDLLLGLVLRCSNADGISSCVGHTDERFYSMDKS